jgi:membrane associated rhomboid family serine protease
MAMSMQGRTVIRLGLALIAAAGLAIDAYVHFDLASAYASIKSSTLSQGQLFRAEGTVAAIAAAAVLLRPRRYTAVFAFVVAAAGTAAVLVYAYVNVGAFGPFPNMYDPLWYPEKTLSVWAEGVGALAALLLFAVLHRDAQRAPARSRMRNGGLPRSVPT